MKELRLKFLLLAISLALVFFEGQPAFGTTTIFTTNTAIASGNTNFDGTDIVVTNCTLTVNGAHSFSSLHVATNGVLTHSPSPGGTVSNYLYVTGEEQVLVGTNAATLVNDNVLTNTVSVTDSTGTIFYVNGQDYLLVSVPPETELQRTASSTIPNGAIVLVNYQALLGTVPAGLNLSIAGNVQVDAGGAINVNGAGYDGSGPGAGVGSNAGGGGGYGGNGGSGSNNTVGGAPYGSYLQATNLGSGGGSADSATGGTGGGLVQISAGGTVTINGLISANGANGTNFSSGGGSGGGISITAQALAGSGVILANGGAGQSPNGGGGGGGRISISYNSTTFNGTMTAYGSSGAMFGTAGTIYTILNGQDGQLVFDNGGQLSATNTTLIIQNTALNVIVRSNASIQTPYLNTTPWSVGSLTIASNGFLVVPPTTAFTLDVISAVTVESSGAITANGKGNGPNTGASGGIYYNDGLYYPGGGGAYGGTGGAGYVAGAAGGVAYGSESAPSGFGGSGGGQDASTGGYGGGSISIVAGGIVQVDGVISANGQNGSGSGGGGGAGGTITLSGGTLLGSGVISANGGIGANSIGGGGGGGRIWINPLTSIFAGTISAYGGNGANRGGAGTVYMQVPGQDTQLVLDNGGVIGTNTPIQSAASSADLVVRGAAIGTMTGSVLFDNLYIYSNSSLSVVAGSPNQELGSISCSLSGNAIVEAGGGIMADFGGYSSGQGPGEGHIYESSSDIPFGSGAGHGGYGGSVGSAAGGTTYDSATQPSDPGSGGGGDSAIASGGPGGGIVRLTVNGTLELDGVISANGGNGGGYAGGGGSGGSIWLTLGTFSGAGSITANGGGGANGLGGGGGGGMVFVSCNNNLFTGPATAYGGAGTNYGGAGTVITQTPSTGYQLVLDGGSNAEALTPLPSVSQINVTLRNGAMGYINGGLTLGNLVINTNATLLISNINTLSCSSLDVQAGGSIVADGTGYAGGQGPGEGHFIQSGPDYACSGGGNSGEGGNSISNLVAGGVTSSGYNEPQTGSGGGNLSPYSIGGAGGGEVSITTTGLMQIDGLISANGLNGGGIGGGGGAGGAITLTCGSLGGGGVIRANGGSGAEMIGGGGGGGWISITVNSTNQFNGTMTAFGGGGANFGGAGFVSTKAGQQGVQYVLDNNGNSGPATPIPTSLSSSTTGLTVRNGGATYLGPTLLTCQNLLIGTNGSLVISNLSEGINCAGLDLEAGGSIIADSNGYAPGLGSESGHSYGESPDFPCGGGGNVGYGGNSISNLATGGGEFTGYTEQAGSGGGTDSPYSVGGNGGGGVSINASGLIQVDGLISANGANGSGIGGGGGAGGSIVLNCASLAGVGTMRANGGSGANLIGGGGGGGGVYITVSSTNQFNGTMTAYGGGGANWGGAGLISTQTSGQGIQLVLDNGGNPGVPTVISSTSSTTSLTVRDASAGMVTSSLSLNSLLITSNSSLYVSNGPNSVTLNLSSADIQAGGSIIADAEGYPAGQGSGAGKFEGLSPDFPCSGAGHGGTGGNSISNLVAGGGPYDSQASPSSPGSGGGQDVPYSTGGAGGGAIYMLVSGLLQVDGTISVNGGNGSGIGGGGGAGGTFRVANGTLAGSGTIRANGGNGAGSIGGGGGGGCIALFPITDNFTGTLAVSGGTGANTGGAGSIYVQTNNGQPVLILDNGGQTGGPTLIDTPSGLSTSLIIRNGAVGYNNGALILGSLLITSNSLLTANSTAGLVTLTVTGNATIESGGGIVTDGLGSGPNSGAGAGHSSGSSGPLYPCGGGGYGGAGGNGSNAAVGGSVYGSITSPGILGSGGGSLSSSVGGPGGGAIVLAVNGTLDAEGRISANGANNSSGVGGGGGSGGSVWLTLGTLEGAGLITANGGNSVENVGGGGGGGRIAITYSTDNFTGSITAHGGSGYAYGGAGTIYTKANSQSVGQVLVENGGNAGTNTPLSAALGPPSTPFNLAIESNAVVSPQASSIFPVVNTLNISTGGSLNGLLAEFTALDVVVLGDANIANSGSISVNAGGDLEGSGLGVGQTSGYTGGGGGYGGVGGASEYAAGGMSYGSAYQPVNVGSGGGYGLGGTPVGSTGGGVLRLNVGGVLTVAGEISAEGTPGIQENSGGGSGGSIWIDTGALAGGGLVASDGGAGEGEGGGGAGGRIALYVRTNAYFGGTSVNGGAGFASGGSGTVFISNNVPTLEVLAESLIGVVTNPVSSFYLTFNGAPNPGSVNSGTVLLTAPNGAAIPVTTTMQNSSTYTVTFPPQTANGTYTLTVSNVLDLYGRPMSPAYTASFTISLPFIQGTVTDGNGNPLPGVLLTPSVGSSATTDPNGNYSIGFAPGSTLTVTPSSGQLTFLPPSISYTNLSNSITGQNYVGVTTIAPMLNATANPANFVLGWQGLPGVDYQVYCSTNLTDWVLCTTTTGSNGPIQISLPTTNGPMMFFSVQATAP